MEESRGEEGSKGRSGEERAERRSEGGRESKREREREPGIDIAPTTQSRTTFGPLGR